MIQAFTELRFLATLRRIARAMEEANRLEKHRQELDYPPIPRADAPVRKTVISHPTVESWNQRRPDQP